MGYSSYLSRVNMVSNILAVFSLLCLGMTNAAPKAPTLQATTNIESNAPVIQATTNIKSKAPVIQATTNIKSKAPVKQATTNIKSKAAVIQATTKIKSKAPVKQATTNLECKPVTFWDCQSGSTRGIPSCDYEVICSQKNGKTTCRDLPSADKCQDDSGKVCTKKTGHTCAVIKTLNLPVSNDKGCTIGEEVVCGDPTKNTLNLQECGKVEQTCKYVNGKATCSDITPKLCRSETGKQCTKLTWTVCGPGTSEESEVIIGGE